MFKLDIKPLSHRLKNNRDTHEDYLKKTIENTDTIRGLVERTRKQNHSEPLLDSAWKFTKHVQELLVYVSQTCPGFTKPSEKLVVVTPMNKVKKVRLKCSTSTCRSQPTCNKRNDRIWQKASSNSKNNIEAQPRKVNKKNRVKEPMCDVNVKHTMLNENSQLICVKCKQCMFDANHDVCFLDFVNVVNVRSKSSSKPNHLWGSNATDVPSSSSLVNDRLSRLFSGIVRFRNDQVAKIMGYGDYQLGNVIILRVYYIKGLGHNLFSVGQFCDADLEIAFRKNTCFIQNLEGVDLLLGSRDTNLYIIFLDDMLKTSLICLLSIALKTKSWLWHRRLPHLNFGTLNKLVKDGLARGIPKFKFQKDHLLIVDDYSRLTWVRFLRSKNEAPEAIIKCIKNIQVRLNATVHNVRTHNGTEFVNQTLRDFYENVDISYQTSIARTPQQNGIVERRN
ncbi:retrovirus-related pol polyprotein from transposon TNT 1-94 [Tanacetum coccineum]